MSHLLRLLPARFNLRFPQLPPATPRNLWLLLSAAVAIQNLSVFQSSQNEHITVFAALVWGGALICMEDQLEDLEPSPGMLGMIAGGIVLVWVLARSSVVLHWDGLIFILAPIAGISLALLCRPLSEITMFKNSMLCLAMLPVFNIVIKLIPEAPLSILTAHASSFWLGMLGFDNIVKDRTVYLPDGGVEVLPSCNGLDMLAQLVCIAIIFQLAFPLRSLLGKVAIFTLAPVVGFASNTIRIAILALCTANGSGKDSQLFKFFHDDLGSLLFSGVAVFVFGLLYMRFLERELPPLPVEGFDEENS
jgi:cyanoexosortase A